MPSKNKYPAGRIEVRNRSGSSYDPPFFATIDAYSCFVDGKGTVFNNKTAFFGKQKSQAGKKNGARNIDDRLISQWDDLYYVDGPYKDKLIDQARQQADVILGAWCEPLGLTVHTPSLDPGTVEEVIAALEPPLAPTPAPALAPPTLVPPPPAPTCQPPAKRACPTKEEGLCKLKNCQRPCWKEASGEVHDYCCKTHADYDLNRIKSANRDDTCKLEGCTRQVYTDRATGFTHEYCRRSHAHLAQGRRTCKLGGCEKAVAWDKKTGDVFIYCSTDHHAEGANGPSLGPTVAPSQANTETSNSTPSRSLFCEPCDVIAKPGSASASASTTRSPNAVRK